MHPHTTKIERELVASADALRSLARDLIGPNQAEDLVQETMLRAWRSPPRAGRLMPWLATILRNLARNFHRDEQRRRARERAVASHGPPQTNPDHDALRAVTEGLWRLPDPYRTTLARRYFGNATPSVIAAETGVPLATVKSRLRRGLAMLRAELQRRHGPSWRAALACATGLGTPPAPTPPLPKTQLAPTAGGMLLMAHATKIICGVGAVAFTALLWLSGYRRPRAACGYAHRDIAADRTRWYACSRRNDDAKAAA